MADITPIFVTGQAPEWMVCKQKDGTFVYGEGWSAETVIEELATRLTDRDRRIAEARELVERLLGDLESCIQWHSKADAYRPDTRVWTRDYIRKWLATADKEPAGG
jgi:beta-galactosidase GanA